MAFTQLQQTQSVIREQQVASKARGSEAMAQAFGQVAQMAMKTSFSLAKEHSQAMFMHAAAQASDIQAQAQIDLIKNPGQADTIQKNAEASIKQAAQSPMNSGDRAKFNYFVSQKQNAIKLQAARTDAHQSLLHNQANYTQSVKTLLSQYSDAMHSQDFKSADILRNNILENGRNAIMSGATSPRAFENVIAGMDKLSSGAQDVMSHLESGEATAAQANAVISNPLAPSNEEASKMIADSGTTVLHNHHVDSMASADLDQAIYANNLHDTRVFSTLLSQSPEKRQSSYEKINGSRMAYGVINSNPPFTHIQQRMVELNSNSNTTIQEKAELHVFNNYIKDLKTNYWRTMSNTSMGFDATNQWIQDSSAATSGSSSQAELQNRLQAADQKYIDSGIAMGEAQHMSTDLINPVIDSIVSAAQTSFLSGGDPAMLIDKMNYVKQNQRPYLAKQLANPTQAAIGRVVANGLGKDQRTDFQRDMILASQAGVDFSALNIKEDGTTKLNDSTLRTYIHSAIPDALSNLASQKNGVDLQGGLMKAGVNYIKYRALKDGDLTLKNIDQYTKDFESEMKKSYDLATGYNYSFNRSQVPLSDGEYETLANGAINDAIKDVRYHNQKWTDSDQLNYVGNTTFTASFSPENKIVVSDQANNIIFSTPYTDSYLNHAKSNHEILKKRFEKSVGETAFSGFALGY
jgi:hypothetical protein